MCFFFFSFSSAHGVMKVERLFKKVTIKEITFPKQLLWSFDFPFLLLFWSFLYHHGRKWMKNQVLRYISWGYTNIPYSWADQKVEWPFEVNCKGMPKKGGDILMEVKDISFCELRFHLYQSNSSLLFLKIISINHKHVIEWIISTRETKY